MVKPQRSHLCYRCLSNPHKGLNSTNMRRTRQTDEILVNHYNTKTLWDTFGVVRDVIVSRSLLFPLHVCALIRNHASHTHIHSLVPISMSYSALTSYISSLRERSKTTLLHGLNSISGSSLRGMPSVLWTTLIGGESLVTICYQQPLIVPQYRIGTGLSRITTFPSRAKFQAMDGERLEGADESKSPLIAPPCGRLCSVF